MATPDLFRAWLTSDDLNRMVGTCSRPAACPIAGFLYDNGVFANVGSSDVLYEDRPRHDSHEQLPEWARAFVAIVDQRYPMQRIVASEALESLNAVLEALS